MYFSLSSFVLTCILILFRLEGIIDWQWYWLLAPIWVPSVIIGVVTIGFWLWMVYKVKRNRR